MGHIYHSSILQKKAVPRKFRSVTRFRPAVLENKFRRHTIRNPSRSYWLHQTYQFCVSKSLYIDVVFRCLILYSTRILFHPAYTIPVLYLLFEIIDMEEDYVPGGGQGSCRHWWLWLHRCSRETDSATTTIPRNRVHNPSHAWPSLPRRLFSFHHNNQNNQQVPAERCMSIPKPDRHYFNLKNNSKTTTRIGERGGPRCSRPENTRGISPVTWPGRRGVSTAPYPSEEPRR